MTMVFLMMVPVIAFVAFRLAKANKTVGRILVEELGALEPVTVRPAAFATPAVAVAVAEKGAHCVGSR